MQKSTIAIAVLFGILVLCPVAFAEQTRDAAEKELAEIQAYIEKYDLDWEAGLTSRLLNYTPEERACGYVRPDNWREICEKHLPPTPPETWFDEFPERFNWEDYGMITPVRDQGQCGSCWIFGSTAALEATYAVQGHGLIDFSEQAVLSCLSYNWGCNGGWSEIVYEHFRDEGAYLESCMPYQADDAIPCIAPYVCEPAGTVYEWFYIANNVEALKAGLMVAPMAVAFYVYEDFNAYWSGCYSHQPVQGEPYPMGHIVLLVGWDDNICPGGAWRAKNSWNTWWGEEGYFWIKYDNGCEFGSEAMLLSINKVDIVTQSPLPDANLCQEYEFQLEATDGHTPYTWSFAGGMYPPGITLDPSGLLHGLPTVARQYYFSVKVEDASLPSARDYRYMGLLVNDVGGICGDVNEDCLVTPLDILELIDYYFNDGPMPASPYASDVNCDGEIDLEDIVRLNKHLFNDGPANCCQLNRKTGTSTRYSDEVDSENN